MQTPSLQRAAWPLGLWSFEFMSPSDSLGPRRHPELFYPHTHASSASDHGYDCGSASLTVQTLGISRILSSNFLKKVFSKVPNSFHASPYIRWPHYGFGLRDLRNSRTSAHNLQTWHFQIPQSITTFPSTANNQYWITTTGLATFLSPSFQTCQASKVSKHFTNILRVALPDITVWNHSSPSENESFPLDLTRKSSNPFLECFYHSPSWSFLLCFLVPLWMIFHSLRPFSNRFYPLWLNQTILREHSSLKTLSWTPCRCRCTLAYVYVPLSLLSFWVETNSVTHSLRTLCTPRTR